MENLRQTIAGANLTLGTDMLSGHRDARATRARQIVGIALVGSAAAGDMAVDLYVDGQRKGNYINSSTGVVVDMDKDFIAMDTYVPANALIEAIITDAGGTNPAMLTLEFGPPTFTGRRSYGTRRSGSYTRRSTGGTRRSSGGYGRRMIPPTGGMYA